jgi:replicative DNA helicase
MYFDYLKESKGNEENGFYIIDVPRGVDANFVDAELDRIESMNNIKLDVVLIDYMQLMVSNGSKGGQRPDDWKEQDSIAAEIHELARNRKIPVISAVQTTSVRSLKSESMRYGTHRVARAEGIANNVNIIIQIEDVIEDEKKKAEVQGEDTTSITYHVIKNRDGAKGVIQMQKDFSKMQIFHTVEYTYAQAE